MHLVAKSGEAAASMLSKQIEGSSPAGDRSAYDPLMSANFSIWSNALRSFGLEMMAEDAPCPLCYKTEMESKCTDPECLKQTGDDWIGFAADEQLNFCRAQGWVSEPS